MFKVFRKWLGKDKKETYTIRDLQGKYVLKSSINKDIRGKVKILFIDDQDLPVLSILEKQKFNISYKKDISNMYDLEGYDVICCDIRGIATKLFSKFEGAYLIKEIKRKYPGKYVIAYTGSTYDTTYNEYFNLADDTIKKGISSEDLIDILDDSIEKYLNPIEKWKKIRKNMLEEYDLDTQFVADIESQYVKAIKEKNCKSFEEFVENMDNTDKVEYKDIVISILEVTSGILGLISKVG